MCSIGIGKFITPITYTIINMKISKRNLNYINFFNVSLLYLLLIQSIIASAKQFNNNTSKTKVQIDDIEGYALKDILVNLSNELGKISREELGIDAIQDIYSKFKYTPIVQDVEKSLQKITDKLEKKLNLAYTVLNQTKNTVESYSKYESLQIGSIITSCPNDDLYGNSIYVEISNKLQQDVVKQKTTAIKTALKHLYLLSNAEVSTEINSSTNSCDDQDQNMLWRMFMQRTNTSPRNIMLLLDHGGSLSNTQLKIVKAIAKQMISVLNPSDNIGIVAISDDWSTPYLTNQCLMPNQIPSINYLHIISQATDHNKYLLNKFVDSLSKGNGVTNHSLGFQQALRTIKMSNVSASDTVMLLYISRGLLSSLTEAKAVLEMISYMLSDIENTIIINTCAVIDVTKPIIYETHFLRDVAEQSYTKYNIDTYYDLDKGVMLSVNSNQSVGLATVRFHQTLKQKFDWKDLGVEFSLPYWSDVSKDLSVSLTVPVGNAGDIGLAGLDLYFFDLVEDIIYYSNYPDHTYAFVITLDGTAVMHPSYPKPDLMKGAIKFVNIAHLEKIDNFVQVGRLLVDTLEGSTVLVTAKGRMKYVWKRVANLYVVCIVVREDEAVPLRPHKVSWFSSYMSNQLIHHRLDILPTMHLCQHLSLLATLDAGSLYLSASCFHSPFAYLQTVNGTNLSSTVLQNYMAYLKDNTKLLANPGLKEEVRDDVIALSRILDFLRTQHLNGYRAKYIVRRFVASPTGVLQIFPGCFIPPSLDPTRRNWFLTANRFKYKVVLTPPYLDAGGAGYIVTVAYATAQVVVGMDVTLGYVYKLMLQRMPFCATKNIKCFMMDDNGYLVYHPNLIDPNGHGPIEQQHIIHKESLVANDMLNYQHFVKKTLCNNYADATVQRYYNLNTSLEEVLVNAVHGEQCVKYQLGAIDGSNVFIGVVNATCEVIATFCPCSTIDRLCLNCNRMEQKECECPCECPLNLDTCTHVNRTFIDNPLCALAPEQTKFEYPVVMQTVGADLKPCMPITCENQLSFHSCLGVLGCEWCEYDVDGETPLPNPFCTAFTACFNGIVGSVTPYGNAVHNLIAEEIEATSSIFYIAGFTVVLFILLGSAFFCHRYFNSPNLERFYFTSVQDNQMRMSDFNDDFHAADNHQDKLLQDSKKCEPLSPYCVSTGYRRPVPAADSDHGYSTMTPHDDSEHLSFAPHEIDSLEDDGISDAASINTSVSSRRPMGNMFEHKTKLKCFSPATDLQLTNLPNRNCIIAPVTVHRNMEMSQ